MRIVHILNDCVDAGNGIICATVDLACEQAKLGHDVYAISAGGEFVPLITDNGVRHIVLDQTHNPLNILQALYKLHFILKEIKPDILHAHMMTGVVLGKALKFFHSYELIATVHNEWQKTSIVMKLADKVIAISEEVKQAMIKRGIPDFKITVVRNGTIGSIREQSFNYDSNITLKRPSITTVAGLYKRKGIDFLIKAFGIVKEKIPEAHLYIIGEGSDRQEFEDVAKKVNGKKDVHFEGFKKNPKLYLKQTDIFVLASRVEPFGLVLSEARESGCAIIGSNVGGIPEVLDNGEAGQLFEVGDYKKLAILIIELLSDPQKLSYWRDKAQKNIYWLSVERVCQDTVDVYKK